mgnify:CR=1 FL=1
MAASGSARSCLLLMQGSFRILMHWLKKKVNRAQRPEYAMVGPHLEPRDS